MIMVNVYCPICGSKINREEMEFCPNCGEKLRDVIPSQLEDTTIAPQKTTIPIKKQTAEILPKPTHDIVQGHPISKPRSKSKLTPGRVIKNVFLVLLMLSFIGGIVVFSIMETVEIDENLTYEYTPETSISETDFAIDISSGAVTIQYNSTPVNEAIFIDARFDAKIKTFGDKDFDEIYDIEADFESSEKLFYVGYDYESSFPYVDNSEFIITLRTDINYSLTVDVSSGNIDIDVPNNTNLGELSIDVSSGQIDLKLNENIITEELYIKSSSGRVNIDANNTTFLNGMYLDSSSGSIEKVLENCVFGGDLYVEISSGNYLVDITELSLTQDIEWVFDGSSGNIEFTMAQNSSLGGEISALFETSSGSQTYTLDLDHSEVFSKWSCDVDSGDITFDYPDNYEKSGDNLESDSYSSSSGLDFIADVSSGNIDVIIN